MMNAEEDSDLEDEIPNINVSDVLVSSLSRSSPQPSSQAALSKDSDDKVFDDEVGGYSNLKLKGFPSGSHTPTQLEVISKPETPKAKASPILPQKSASNLFGDENQHDLFSTDYTMLPQVVPGPVFAAQAGQSVFTETDAQSKLFPKEGMPNNHVSLHSYHESTIIQSSMSDLTTCTFATSNNRTVDTGLLVSGSSANSHSHKPENLSSGHASISSIDKNASFESCSPKVTDYTMGTSNQTADPCTRHLSSRTSALSLSQQSAKPQDGCYHYAQQSSHSEHVHMYSLPPTSYEQKTSDGLFIPEIYSQATHKQEQSPSFQYFVPSQAPECSARQNQLSAVSNTSQSCVPNDSLHSLNSVVHESVAFPGGGYQYPHQSEYAEHSPDKSGFWQWLSNPGTWSESAVKLKEGLKSATDKVLTTLDPGMEEYLKPVINVGVASQDTSILAGVKNGCGNAFGVAVVKGQHVRSNVAVLPVGFAPALQGVNQLLDAVSYVNFGFSSSYVLMAALPLIIELTPGSWYAMFCLGLRDVARNLLVHGFSQPISVPYDVVMTAYSRSRHDASGDFTGYDISIDEAVKVHVPYTKEQDWCSALIGVPVHQVVSIAAQCLAATYKRQTEGGSFLPTHQSQQTYQPTNSIPASPECGYNVLPPPLMFSDGQVAYDLGL